MNSSFTGLKALVTYAVLVPLAILIGYFLSNPLDYSTFGVIGTVLFILIIPLILKLHQPLLLFSWNMAMVIPFIKGQPSIGLLMAALTLGIAIFERSLSREMRFMNVRSITFPLLLLIAVVLTTAKMTGGFGLRAFGSEVYGGKKYIFLLAGIGAYFALTAWRIPVEKTKLYLSLFFLGGITALVGDFFPITPSWLQFIYWFFPPSAYGVGKEFEVGVTRLAGTGAAAQALLFFLILRHGLRGIFLAGKPWRWALFVLLFFTSFLGGFRSLILSILLVCAFQFFLEGLHRTRLLPIFALVGLLAAALVIPLAPKLPFTFQRALAFLPLEIDSRAVLDAEDSSQWRIKMWEALLPQVPKYFWLGKGYAISQEDYAMMGYDTSFQAFDASQQGLALAGDYHSGPLSIILPFGIWGVIVFVWLMISGTRLLYYNFRYGDPELRLANSTLFSLFLMHLVMFTFVVGALQIDLWTFVGIFGMSVALNHGAAKKPVQVSEQPQPLQRPRLMQPRPSFQR